MVQQEAFGSYTFLERLAVGGMAEVFLARSSDPAHRGRTVVVKRMLPQLLDREEAVTMFLDEARLGALLKHPHIVEILDVGQIDGFWYMALEYVDGPDLSRILRRPSVKGTPPGAPDDDDNLPIALAVWIVARAAEGLHHAHTLVEPTTQTPLALVHRDVSPHNILVSRDGGVRVADFGVAKTQVQLHRTLSGEVKGKLSYMSPEQLGNQPLDARTDVLALGVTLWEALSGRRIYGGLTDVQIMMKVTLETPPSLRSMGVDVDDELDAIAARCLHRDRELRWPDAGALAAALDAWSTRQALPPSRAQLSTWLRAHFVPRATVSDVVTEWARAAPDGSARADDEEDVASPAHAAVGEDDTTELDMRVVAAHSAVPAAVAPAPAPAPAGPAGMPRLVPVGRLRPLVTPAPVPMPGNKRELVLYVEDERQNWDVAELLLKKDFDLLHAADDRSACELVRARASEISAVLMDIQLKGSALDGIDLVRLLRGSSTSASVPTYARDLPRLAVPIFFVTAFSARYAEQELLAVGADKLVTKPVDFAQLTMALTSFQLRRAAALRPG